jgi:hypothetical protein
LRDKWDIEYVKEYERRLVKKGQYDSRWGFRVETDFHIISQMGSRKYIDLLSNTAVLKRPNGFKSQLWYFDGKTKTIRSRKTTSYSLQIQSSGKSNKIVITSTSSRWW